MTIQLPTTSQPSPDLSSRPSVAMDLSPLGAEVFDGMSDFGEDFPVEQANMAKVAGLATAGISDGLAGVTLGQTFFLRSDTHLRESRLDAIQAALKIADRVGGPVTAAVPADPFILRAALEAIVGRNATVEVKLDGAPLAPITGLLQAARARGVVTTFAITDADLEIVSAAELAELADGIRLRESNIETAREIRAQFKAVAPSLPIIADVYVIVSACAMDAEERASLISMIGVDRYADGAPRVHGTVHDVADHMEAWVEGGAADGFTVLPGSLPTDLASVVRGVLPLLEARCETGEHYQALAS